MWSTLRQQIPQTVRQRSQNTTKHQALLQRLTLAHENILANQTAGLGGKHHLVSVRTPVREVAVANVDQLGRVRLFKRMLERAVGDGLLEKARFEAALSEWRKERRKKPTWVESSWISAIFQSELIGWGSWRNTFSNENLWCVSLDAHSGLEPPYNIRLGTT